MTRPPPQHAGSSRRQRSRERDVAIKIFDDPASLRDERVRKRFKHETLLLARMQHPPLPVVLTHGEIAGLRDAPLLYTVLEFIRVHGSTQRSRTAAGSMRPSRREIHSGIRAHQSRHAPSLYPVEPVAERTIRANGGLVRVDGTDVHVRRKSEKTAATEL